jgi:2-polyprenyl-3-methyl-5-hydroxy-6-metoxy-1,4-benzoquinol methylase
MTDNIDLSRKYYDERFGSLDQKLNEEETIRWKTISKTINGLNLGKNLKIADFGCGRGWLSGKLSEFGSVTGFDLSDKAIENAKSNFPDLKFECLDASASIPEKFKDHFDLVVSSEVLEHITKQKKYIQNLSSLLRKNGKLVLTTPNGKWKTEFYRNGREAWKQPVENWVKEQELIHLCKNEKVKVLNTTSFNSEWIFNFQPGSFRILSNSLTRKLLKLSGCYSTAIKTLNKRGSGLNLILLGEKTND